jgi:flagellar assembly protein FliH
MSSLPNVIDFEATGASAIPDRLLSQSRSEAAAVGYAHGWSQGLREARESLIAEQLQARATTIEFASQREDALAAALTAIGAVADRLEATAAPTSVGIENQLLSAAVDIAEALLGRELRDTDDAARSAIARVLKLTPNREEVRIRINADVYDALGAAELPALLVQLSAAQGRQVILEPDNTLAAADAIGHCGASTIDARLSAGVERLRKHLAS